MKRLSHFLTAGLLAVSFLGCAAEGDELQPFSDDAVVAEDLPRATVVQLFNWPFQAIADEACELRRMGFSHVHVSPPQASNPAIEWWGRYQPADYRVIDSPLGTEAEFKAMTARAEQCGLTIIADVVLNHMANFGLGQGDLFYPRGCDRSAPLDSGGDSCLFAPQNFHNEECITNYDNQCAVMYGRICGGGSDRGLPDLATGFCEFDGTLNIHARNYDPHVLQMAREYLIRLQDLGVRAFRFDAAKHMHPAFLYDLLTDPAVTARTEYMYGEIIANQVSDASLENYRHIPELDFMDFPLTRNLIDAFSFGGDLGILENITGTDRALDGLTSVSFVTNHDVWGNEGGLGYRFSSYQDELLAHLFVLGRGDGLAYVYSEFDDGPSKQYRGIGEDYVKFHQRTELQGMLAFRTRMLGEPTLPKWKDSVHLAFSRGDRGFVAINKSGDDWYLGDVASGLADGKYIDALSGDRHDVVAGRIQGSAPARWGLMLIPAGECGDSTCSL